MNATELDSDFGSKNRSNVLIAYPPLPLRIAVRRRISIGEERGGSPQTVASTARRQQPSKGCTSSTREPLAARYLCAAASGNRSRTRGPRPSRNATSKPSLNPVAAYCRDGPDGGAAFRNRHRVRAVRSGPFRTTGAQGGVRQEGKLVSPRRQTSSETPESDQMSAAPGEKPRDALAEKSPFVRRALGSSLTQANSAGRRSTLLVGSTRRPIFTPRALKQHRHI